MRKRDAYAAKDNATVNSLRAIKITCERKCRIFAISILLQYHEEGIHLQFEVPSLKVALLRNRLYTVSGHRTDVRE